MSGHKRATVKISEEEYRRLHEADMKRRFKEHRKEAKTAKQSADLTDALQEMEDRQQQLEQALRELDRDFNWIGAEVIQDVLAENARYCESLTRTIQQTNAEADASLARLSQQFSEEMQRERERYHVHLQSLVQRIAGYEHNEQAKAEAARGWLKRAAAMADFIQARFDHERFLPGRLSSIMNSLSFAQNNLAGGFFESSLQTSQQSFLQLSELRVELEQLTLEWQREYERAWSALSHFIAELEMNSTVNAFGLEGEELPEQIELAYWSNGQYRQLLDKSSQLLDLLSQEQRSISTEELTRTHTELLPVITERFETIIYESRLKALNSQLRMNIAERALQALEMHGFRLSASGYTNQDMRTAFTISLENPEGSRVKIEVLPSEGSKQELTNELVVITNHPTLKTEHEARLQWQELSRTLQQYDLNVSHPEVLPALLTSSKSPERTPLRSEPRVHSKRFHNV